MRTLRMVGVMTVAVSVGLMLCAGLGAQELKVELLTSFEPGQKGVDADGEVVKEYATQGEHALKMENHGQGYTGIKITDRAVLAKFKDYVLLKVDVFNPRKNRLESGGETLVVRGNHSATLLRDGTILIVGGMTETVTYRDGTLHEERRFLKSIELYDPRTKSSRLLKASLQMPRQGQSATLFDDGSVLIIGGTWEARTEIIDPAGETVKWGPPLNIDRADQRTTRLADGRLLITGGTASNLKTLDTAEIFDPAANRFTMLAARMNHKREDHTADLLSDGRVLITGGEDNKAGPDGSDIILDDVEIFDPKTETFAKLAPLSVKRDDLRSTVLPDDVVLVTGGQDTEESGLRSAEFVIAPARGELP